MTSQPIPLPSPTASPEEVRTYFTALLTTHHDLSPPAAAALVAPWTLGGGSELTYYSRATYLALFAPEVGDVLYGHVNGLLGVTRGHASRIARRRRDIHSDLFGLPPTHTILLVLAAATSGLVLSARAAQSRGVAIALMCAAALSFVGFLVAYCLVYFT